MKEKLLSLKDVSIKSNGVEVLHSLTLEMQVGESLAVIGNSGSGKTTLLNALAGKLPFAAGTARFPYLDRVVDEHRKEDPLFSRFRTVAQVSSRHGFTSLSKTNDLYYQQRFNSGDSENAATVSQHLDDAAASGMPGFWNVDRVTGKLRLGDLLDKHLIKLSNGETKRVLIASALLRNPALLLLDQPMTGLDVAGREDLENTLLEVAASGVAMVIAAFPWEIPRAAGKVVILENGTISSISTPGDIGNEGAFKGKQFAFPGINELVRKYPPQTFNILVGMREVNISYGGRKILENINWTIRPGERWMLTGPNGAGKSTLLSLIFGDNPQAFSQDITLFDRKKGSGESIWDIKRKIGFMSPELFQFFPGDVTCAQAVESGFYDTIGLFRKTDEVKRKAFLQWMKVLGIEEFANIRLGQVALSVQRLALLARALVKEPPLLILDEPCQGLDMDQQNRFKGLVDSIAAETEISLVYVSHYQHEMPACITDFIHIVDGKIDRVGRYKPQTS